jgi:phospholipid-translocating ATPase
LLPEPPFDPISNAFPFILVICITAIKQAYEDVLRHNADRKVNNKLATVLRNDKFVKIQSKKIKVLK